MVEDAAAVDAAMLPLKVLLFTVSVPMLLMPPPSPALLPEKVLLVTVSVPHRVDAAAEVCAQLPRRCCQ